jgi:hypothetical protein
MRSTEIVHKLPNRRTRWRQVVKIRVPAILTRKEQPNYIWWIGGKVGSRKSSCPCQESISSPLSPCVYSLHSITFVWKCTSAVRNKGFWEKEIFMHTYWINELRYFWFCEKTSENCKTIIKINLKESKHASLDTGVGIKAWSWSWKCSKYLLESVLTSRSKIQMIYLGLWPCGLRRCFAAAGVWHVSFPQNHKLVASPSR